MATTQADVTLKEQRRPGELTKSDLLRVYRTMLTGRRIDEKHLILLKQGKSFFHIGGSGHEAAQTAAASALTPGVGYSFPYYRDLSFCLPLGFSPEETYTTSPFPSFFAAMATPTAWRYCVPVGLDWVMMRSSFLP